MADIVNPAAARAVMQKLEQKINAMPAEEFGKAMRAMERQRHNAKVEEARAAKRARKQGR